MTKLFPLFVSSWAFISYVSSCDRLETFADVHNSIQSMMTRYNINYGSPRLPNHCRVRIRNV